MVGNTKEEVLEETAKTFLHIEVQIYTDDDQMYTNPGKVLVHFVTSQRAESGMLCGFR